MTWYLKSHYCADCKLTWEAAWDCLCDDRCPNCNTSCEYTEIICEFEKKDDQQNYAPLVQGFPERYGVIYTECVKDGPLDFFIGTFDTPQEAQQNFRREYRVGIDEQICSNERLVQVLGPVDMFNPKIKRPDPDRQRIIAEYGYSLVRRKDFPADFATRANPTLDFSKLMKRLNHHLGDWVVWDPHNCDNGYMLIGNDPNVLLKEAFNHLDLGKVSSVKSAPEPVKLASKPEPKKLYSGFEIEAALCVWEHINDITLPDSSHISEAWSSLRESVGSMELRHASIEIGKWCLKVYDLCVEAEPEIFHAMSYDWEVIPLIFSHCKNEGAPTIEPSTFPDANAIALTVIEAAGKRMNPSCP